MNKTLRNILISAGVLAVGTTLYFVFRKPKDKSDDETKSTDEKETEKKEDDKQKSEDTSETKTPPSPSSSPSAKPPVEGLKAETKPSPNVNTDKLKGFGVGLILSKVKNPSLLKGKVVSSANEGTVLMGAKGNKLFTLKKDTIVGKLLGSKLTKKGFYLVYVKMNDGKTVTVNGTDLKFA